jgi:hypothetical protein
MGEYQKYTSGCEATNIKPYHAENYNDSKNVNALLIMHSISK